LNDNRSDKELMFATCDGNASAFEVLVNRHWRRLVHYVDMATGSAVDSEDIVQEAFMRAFIARHNFRFESLFSTWITSITRNELSRAIRKKRTFRMKAPTVSRPDEPGEILMWREKTRMIRNSIKELPRLQRESIQLTRYGGLSCAEAARILETSDDAVRSAVYKGQRKLREMIDNDD
jgi:RNA polymerase sigma factor (sigma-70 family)